MAEDDFVNIRLGELLRLDFVLLTRPEQIIQKRDIHLQYFHELDDAAVGNVELAVEVERTRIAVGAIFRKFSNSAGALEPTW